MANVGEEVWRPKQTFSLQLSADRYDQWHMAMSRYGLHHHKHLSHAKSFSEGVQCKDVNVSEQCGKEFLQHGTGWSEEGSFTARRTRLPHRRTGHLSPCTGAKVHEGGAIPHHPSLSCLAKGVQKKSASKKKDCDVIRPWIKSITNHMYWVAAGGGEAQYMLEKWQSVTNHVSSIHSHQGKLYTECTHGPIDQERDWIRPGSRAHKAVKLLLRRLWKANICFMLFPNCPLSIRLLLPSNESKDVFAAFHYNENSQNAQAVTKAGEPRWTISYPKAKKGTSSAGKQGTNTW